MRNEHPVQKTVKRKARFLPRIVNRFKKEDDGVTSVEFALVGLPFFFLLFAIIEASLHFFAGQLLESSVDQTARMVRTGQLDSNSSAQDFRAEVCRRAIFLFNCDGLYVDLTVAATFEDLADPPGPVAGVMNPGSFSYTAPGPEQVIMITVQYEWPVVTNYVQSIMSDLSNGKALLSAIAVFKSEPYPAGGAGGGAGGGGVPSGT